MELKIVCQCGQKYKFDVEPVNGRMPVAVNCPTCNAEGTAAANAIVRRRSQKPRKHKLSRPRPLGQCGRL
jgi:hypothetical protein